MKPARQTVFYDKDAGIHGNCLAACLASLFDLPIDAVPALNTMGEEWCDAFLKFLDHQGYEYDGQGNLEELKSSKGYVIVCGMASRGVLHAVIYKDGERFFDPHPSDEFLTEERFYYIINRKGGSNGIV
jgi:hypothetical protein